MTNASIYTAFERMWLYITSILSSKANKADTYTKTEVDTAIENNTYTLPTASSTLGGVKTTSTVTSASGYTACPIISGVPYYKDTDTTYSLSSFGITATTAELNKLDGVTATTTEINYVDGVTSNIQTQLNNKQATITGGATTIATSNLTASRALVSNGSGKVAVSAVTSTELGYLDGVTSGIQSQLNGKVPTTRTVNGKALSSNITLTASDLDVYTKTEADTTIATLLNRTTAVNTANTSYTTLMARGSSLNSSETTPNVNGAIAWTYE